MAKETKQKGVLTTYEPDDYRKVRDKWKNKKEFDTVKLVRERFNEMADFRRQSCPFPPDPDEVSNIGDINRNDNFIAGHDWALQWNRDAKNYAMIKDYIDGRSNISLPTIFAPIEAIRAEAMDSKTGVYMEPIDEMDKRAVEIIEATINHERQINNMHSKDVESKVYAAIFGTSIEYVGYKKEEREVEMMLTKEERDEEIEKMFVEKDLGEEGVVSEIVKAIKEERKPMTKKARFIDYEGLTKIRVSIYDFYVDPLSRDLHGDDRPASDCIWRDTPSVEMVLQEFSESKDGYIIKENLDKIKSATEAAQWYMEDDTKPLFEVSQDMIDQGTENRVELVRYYNRRTDKYIVIANDIVLRDGPLPYNHKQLPFVVHRYIKMPDVFFGMSLPYTLQNPKKSSEILINMQVEQAWMASTPPMLINSNVFEAIDSQWDKIESGQKIEVNGSTGPDSLRFVDIPGPRFDVGNLVDRLNEVAVMGSGINPMQYAMPTDQPVRNNLLLMESSQKMIRKFFETWAQGEVWAYKQFVSLIQQFYPESYQMIQGTNGLEKQYKKIKVEDYEITDEGTEPIKGSSSFEVRPQDIQLASQIDFKIDTDNIMELSKSLKIQAYDKMVAQLLPILANPQLMQNPMVVEMVKGALQLNGAPRSMIDKLKADDSYEEEEEAVEENMIIMQGEMLSGYPGRSDSHIRVHSELLLELSTNLIGLYKMQAPQEQTMQLEEIIKNLSMHISEDQAPGEMIGMVATGKAQALTAPPQEAAPAPEGMPMDETQGIGAEAGAGMPPQ